MKEFVAIAEDWQIPSHCSQHNLYCAEEPPMSGIYRCYGNGQSHRFTWREIGGES